MESLIQDVRHGIGSLASSQGFVLLSILCLGVGIGATTTVFSEVSATDPVSFAGVALLLASVGLVASYAPAYRAAGVDPIASLRD